MKTTERPSSLDSYREVENWLFDQTPNYHLRGGREYRPGVQAVQQLLKAMGNPERKLNAIHIAGTNGKGSVAHLIASIYQEGNYRTGLFTSPHIVDFRERIKIDGQCIPQAVVLDFVRHYRALFEELQVSFFEITTAMAFAHFAREQVAIAVVETGLGGRLDATNVLSPELAIITHIGLDHTSILGHSLRAIAKEKAGIIKRQTPVLIGRKQQATTALFRQIAEQKNAPIHYATPTALSSPLMGQFQQENTATAVCAVNLLNASFPLEQQAVRQGVMKVVENTQLKGRLQVLQRDPLVLLDAAHNPPSVQQLMKEVEQMRYEQLHIVYGAAKDKDSKRIFSLFPPTAHYYFCVFDSQRSLKQHHLAELAEQAALNYSVFLSPTAALDRAREQAGKQDAILLFGSFLFMADILRHCADTDKSQ